MKKNIGATDKLIRLVIILAIAIFNYLGVMPKISFAYASLVIAVYILLTTFANFSPIYAVFKFSTNKKDQ